MKIMRIWYFHLLASYCKKMKVSLVYNVTEKLRRIIRCFNNASWYPGSREEGKCV